MIWCDTAALECRANGDSSELGRREWAQAPEISADRGSSGTYDDGLAGQIGHEMDFWGTDSTPMRTAHSGAISPTGLNLKNTRMSAPEGERPSGLSSRVEPNHQIHARLPRPLNRRRRRRQQPLNAGNLVLHLGHSDG